MSEGRKGKERKRKEKKKKRTFAMKKEWQEGSNSDTGSQGNQGAPLDANGKEKVD